MRKYILRTNVLLYFLLLFIGNDVYAQESTTVDSSIRVQPESIPLSDINEEAEQIRSELSLTEQRVLSNSPLARLDTQFNVLRDEFQIRQEQYQRFRQVTPNIQKLENEIRSWNRFEDLHNKLQANVNDFQARAEVGTQNLDFMFRSWQLSKTEAARLDAPPVLQFTIDNTIDRISEVREGVKEKLNFSLELETRITTQKQLVEDIINDLQDWSNSGELNVFRKRHKAIWNTSFAARPDTSTTTRLKSIGSRFSESTTYFEDYPTKLRTLFIILLISFSWVFILLRLLKSNIDLNLPEFRIRNAIENHPSIVSVFLVLLSAFFVFTNLPGVLAQSLVIVTLFAATFILRPYMRKRYIALIWLLLIAHLIDTLKSYIWFSSSTYRLYLYIEAMFGLGVIWYYLIRSKAQTLDKSTLNRFLKNAGYLIVIFELIVIISNTLGYTNLSDLLLKVSTQGAIITMLVLTILFVLGGVIHLTIAIYHARHDTLHTKEYRNAIRVSDIILRAVCILIWTVNILQAFEFLRPILATLELWLTEPWTAGDFSVTPGQILSMMMVMTGGYVAARFISALLNTLFLDLTHVSSGVLSAISMIIRYFIAVFVIAMILGIFSIDTSKFGLVAGALGVGIGFGLQNIVANFIAGVILTFERPLEPGETIEFNNMMGIVRKVGVRSTQIRAFDGSHIFVPNSSLLSNDLINWSRSDQHKRIEVRVGVAYGSNVEKVKEVLLSSCRQYSYALSVPEPMPLFDSFSNSSIDFRLLFWVPIDFGLTAKSEVSRLVYNNLAEAGIQIPYPRQDITILKGDSREPEGEDDELNEAEQPG